METWRLGVPSRMGRRHSHRTNRHTLAYMFVSRLAMMMMTMAMTLMMVLIVIVMVIVAMATVSGCKLQIRFFVKVKFCYPSLPSPRLPSGSARSRR